MMIMMMMLMMMMKMQLVDVIESQYVAIYFCDVLVRFCCFSLQHLLHFQLTCCRLSSSHPFTTKVDSSYSQEVLSRLQIPAFRKVFVGSGPFTVTGTTGSFMFLVGDPYKPPFATVTGRGPPPRYLEDFFF